MKLRMSENRTVASTLSAAQRLASAGQQLIGETRIHIARHGRLHALFRRNIVEHQKQTDPLHAFAVFVFGHQRQGGQVDGNLLALHFEHGVHEDVLLQALVDDADAVQNPGVRAGEKILRGLADHFRRLGAQNAEAGIIAGGDAAFLVQRHYAV